MSLMDKNGPEPIALPGRLGRGHGSNLQIREIAHDGVAEPRQACDCAFQELGDNLDRSAGVLVQHRPQDHPFG
jgi:hypothetical protein